MAVLMLAIMIHLIRVQSNLPSIRLATTRMPPEMSLEKGMFWHLFLSHIVRRR